jgi:hypothetical protein
MKKNLKNIYVVLINNQDHEYMTYSEMLIEELKNKRDEYFKKRIKVDIY